MVGVDYMLTDDAWPYRSQGTLDQARPSLVTVTNGISCAVIALTMARELTPSSHYHWQTCEDLMLDCDVTLVMKYAF